MNDRPVSDGGDQLQRVARELYALEPGDFTAARSAAVAQARGAGDRPLADRVGKLRRPAVAAWAVNVLVRERAELVEQVLDLGASMRAAQAQLEGAALRDLNRQRRQLLAAVTAQAGDLAAAHGMRLSASVVRQVEDTVQAAMADPAAAAAVSSGLLAQPLSSTGLASLTGSLGFETTEVESGVEPAGVGPGSASDEQRDNRGLPSSSSRPALTLVAEDQERARRTAEKRVAKAEKTLRKATKARSRAVKAKEAAQARVLQSEAGIEELRHRLAEAEAEAEDAGADLTERESALEEAEASMADAERAAQAARQGRDALESR